MRRLEIFIMLGLTACLADTDPGGKVGSETHFLNSCIGHDDCPSSLSCLCGVCTSLCTDTCELGVCAGPGSAATVSYCGAPQTVGLCLASCEDGCDCADGICLAGPRPDGAACETHTDCEGGECTLDLCGSPCASDSECPARKHCLVRGAVAGTCVPGAMQPSPEALDGGTIPLGTTKTMQLLLIGRDDRTIDLVRIAIETRDATPPTEVSIDHPLPVTIDPQFGLFIEVQLAPNREGPRPYRLVLWPSDDAPPLQVLVDFAGTP